MRFVFFLLLGLGFHLISRAASGKQFPGAPLVKPERGFYFNPIQVTISTDTPAAGLVYTIDGSEPSLTNGIIIHALKREIPVTTTTTLRVMAFKADAAMGIATHTYIFPAEVARQTRPAGVPENWPGNFPASFTLSMPALKNSSPGYDITNALLSIPSISLVVPATGLWGSKNGLYANPNIEEERSSSVEILFPAGPVLQANAGVSLRGFASRVKSLTPKHSFTIVFRSKYGPTKISGPLFPDTKTTNFNALILRANAVDSWANSELNWNHSIDGEKRWYRDRATYLRDQWMRDSERDLEQPCSHGRFVHLYLNGSYWGLYNLDERLDKHWAAEYQGGKASDYDIVASGKLKGGTFENWNKLMAACRADLSQNSNYQRLMGNNADGSRNPECPILLDLNSLVDYMILHIYAGADDWPWHNWVAIRSQTAASKGFKFLTWDQELSINSLVKEHTDMGQGYAEVNAENTPAFVYARCRANAAFRRFFAQQVQRHLLGSGILSTKNNIARYMARADEIDHAIVAESARWGAFYRPENPYLRQKEWIQANQWMCETFFPGNEAVAMRRFHTAGLTP